MAGARDRRLARLISYMAAGSYDTEGYGEKCVERYCERASTNVEQTNNVSTLGVDHQFKEEELEPVAELSKVSSRIVLRCLYLARIGRPGILRSVDKQAREVTKWTRACDKRFAGLLSHTHFTSSHRRYCHVANTVSECRVCFQSFRFCRRSWKFQNRLQEECCASSDVAKLC